ncbi:MAG: hypothetical protein ACKVOH_00150, partial [Chlamydiales bacterium]
MKTVEHLSCELSPSYSEGITQQILGLSDEENGQRPFPSRKSTRDASQVSEDKAQIKGFLFATSDGKWVLSQEPNLKTCCVGKPTKSESQIFLEGDFFEYPQNRVLVCQGFLISEQCYGNDGSTYQRY